MKNITALLAGLIFGFGLIISGMGNPAKVQNFLDIFGRWDPSLGLVMAGAIIVAFFAFTWAKKQQKSLLDEPMQLPTNTKTDKRLLMGASMFGAGWGLAGFCPAPAVMNLSTLSLEVWVFVAAMLVGMVLQHRWAKA